MDAEEDTAKKWTLCNSCGGYKRRQTFPIRGSLGHANWSGTLLVNGNISEGTFLVCRLVRLFPSNSLRFDVLDEI